MLPKKSSESSWVSLRNHQHYWDQLQIILKSEEDKTNAEARLVRFVNDASFHGWLLSNSEELWDRLRVNGDTSIESVKKGVTRALKAHNFRKPPDLPKSSQTFAYHYSLSPTPDGLALARLQGEQLLMRHQARLEKINVVAQQQMQQLVFHFQKSSTMALSLIHRQHLELKELIESQSARFQQLSQELRDEIELTPLPPYGTDPKPTFDSWKHYNHPFNSSSSSSASSEESDGGLSPISASAQMPSPLPHLHQNSSSSSSSDSTGLVVSTGTLQGESTASIAETLHPTHHSKPPTNVALKKTSSSSSSPLSILQPANLPRKLYTKPISPPKWSHLQGMVMLPSPEAASAATHLSPSKVSDSLIEKLKEQQIASSSRSPQPFVGSPGLELPLPQCLTQRPRSSFIKLTSIQTDFGKDGRRRSPTLTSASLPPISSIMRAKRDPPD